MNQRWSIAIVAVVGIGLAMLLFPRPDTGGSIPGSDPANVDPLGFENGKNLPPNSGVNPSVVGKPRARSTRTTSARARSRGSRNRIAQRNRPEAIYASKKSSRRSPRCGTR